MQIEDGKVVAFHFVMTDAQGSFTERSAEDKPVHYLHGRGNLMPGLEARLAGHAAGDRLTVTLAPEQAYGPRNPYPLERVPLKHVLTRGPYRPGMRIAIRTQGGARQMTVAKVGRFNLDVDPNHPLAGRTLTFEIEILEVRDASPEELAHGHAHAPGAEHH